MAQDDIEKNGDSQLFTETPFLISELRKIGAEFHKAPVIQAVLLESANRLEELHKKSEEKV